jgi:hypothetical protein
MGSVDAYYHASKLYPAIVSGRPILAVCHAESSIRTVMADTGAGRCVTFDRVEELAGRVDEIADAIEELTGRPRRVPAASIFEPFTARASTGVLARVLDRITAPPSLADASEPKLPMGRGRASASVRAGGGAPAPVSTI